MEKIEKIIMQHYGAITDIVAIISLFFFIVLVFGTNICIEEYLKGEQE